MLVSVIIPVHNGQAYLADAIRSVLLQTAECWELVLVDDGSTDASPRIIASAVDGVRVHSVRTERPNGAGPARMAGAAGASGNWVAFLDQDDVWDPHKLGIQIDAVGPGVDLVHTAARLIDPAGRVIGGRLTQPAWAGEAIQWPRIMEANPVIASSVLVRREAFDAAGGFDPAVALCEDYALWLALAALGRRFHFVDLALLSYRLHPAQASRDEAAMHEGAAQALERTWERFQGAFSTADLATLQRRVSALRQVEAERGGNVT
jgi:glycosyltransferase involved in cell wall biosynthesis